MIPNGHRRLLLFLPILLLLVVPSDGLQCFAKNNFRSVFPEKTRQTFLEEYRGYLTVDKLKSIYNTEEYNQMLHTLTEFLRGDIGFIETCPEFLRCCANLHLIDHQGKPLASWRCYPTCGRSDVVLDYCSSDLCNKGDFKGRTITQAEANKIEADQEDVRHFMMAISPEIKAYIKEAHLFGYVNDEKTPDPKEEPSSGLGFQQNPQGMGYESSAGGIFFLPIALISTML